MHSGLAHVTLSLGIPVGVTPRDTSFAISIPVEAARFRAEK
jgi:hypothetical protein